MLLLIILSSQVLLQKKQPYGIELVTPMEKFTTETFAIS